MRNVYFLIVLALVAVGAAVVFRSADNSEVKAPPLSSADSKALETKISAEGAVTVKVTPKNIAEGVFEIIFDTHSVELNEDMTRVAFLKNDSGKEYQPRSWEGDPPGGHHREGLLKFGALSPEPKNIELVIRGIGGVMERKFSWTIQP